MLPRNRRPRAAKTDLDKVDNQIDRLDQLSRRLEKRVKVMLFWLSIATFLAVTAMALTRNSLQDIAINSTFMAIEYLL